MLKPLLDLSKQLILRLPQSSRQCKLLARHAVQSLRAGDAQTATQLLKLCVSRLNFAGTPLERAFTMIEVGNACANCGLIEDARDLLRKVEQTLEAEKTFPGTAGAVLLLADSIARLGDPLWIDDLLKAQPTELQAEVLSTVSICAAKEGRWKEALIYLGDQRLRHSRNYVIAEVLIWLAAMKLTAGAEDPIAESVIEGLSRIDGSLPEGG